MKVTKHITIETDIAQLLIDEANTPSITQTGIIEESLRAYFDGRIMKKKNPFWVEETSVGPTLRLDKIIVSSWFGTKYNKEAKELCNKLNASI